MWTLEGVHFEYTVWMHPCIWDAPCHWGEYECSRTKGEKQSYSNCGIGSLICSFKTGMDYWDGLFAVSFSNQQTFCTLFTTLSELWWVRAVGYFVLFFNITKDWSCSRQFAATEVIQKESSSNHNSTPNVTDWGRGHFVLLKEKKKNTGKYAGFTEVRLYDS